MKTGIIYSTIKTKRLEALITDAADITADLKGSVISEFLASPDLLLEPSTYNIDLIP
jgi:hypothetical protein